MIHGENIIYVRIDWKNYPSDKTPVNESNLNKMDLAIHLLDERVVWLNENKFDKSESFKLVKNIDLDEETGIFTITYYDNTFKKIDTILEKVATNWDYDEISQQLVITLDDGTVKNVDLSALITQYEFMTSETISFEVQNDGKVKAAVREGSIQEKHLRPDYLSDIRLEQRKAQQSAEDAEGYAKLSESYARGGTGIREEENTDNAMEYARQAKENADRAETIVNEGIVTGVKGENEETYRTGKISLGIMDLLWNYSANFGATIDNVWHDTEIEGEVLKNGFYIVRSIVYVHLPESITGQKEFVGVYSGMMEWRNLTSPDLSEEIILNFSGETKDDLRFFMRTIGKQDKKTTLQFAFNYYLNPSYGPYVDINFNFVKIF